MSKIKTGFWQDHELEGLQCRIQSLLEAKADMYQLISIFFPREKRGLSATLLLLPWPLHYLVFTSFCSVLCRGYWTWLDEEWDQSHSPGFFKLWRCFFAKSAPPFIGRNPMQIPKNPLWSLLLQLAPRETKRVESSQGRWQPSKMPQQPKTLSPGLPGDTWRCQEFPWEIRRRTRRYVFLES